MSKTIKVEDKVYQDLDQLRGKGDTFGQVIDQLIKDRVAVFHFLNVLEGQIKYGEWREKQLRKLQATAAQELGYDPDL